MTRHRERGAVSLEMVILAPAILALIFGIIQGGLFLHARNTALAASQEGVRAATGYHSSDGAAQAREFISDAGGARILQGVTVSASRTGDTVTVTVTGQAVSVFPGVPGPRVEQHSTGPVEQWIGAGP